MLGVVQEQHAERARLFAQWQQFDWPILHDPVNSLRTQAVPYFIAIDEAGKVVDENLTESEYEAFLNRPAAQKQTTGDSASQSQESLDALDDANGSTTKTSDRSELTKPLLPNKHTDASTPNAEELAALAEHRILWESIDALSGQVRGDQLDQAIEEYSRAIELDPENPHFHFGRGVAYRMRFDEVQIVGEMRRQSGRPTGSKQSVLPGTRIVSPSRTNVAQSNSAENSAAESKANLNDFQAAIDSWSRALELDPNQYIYRRRIQQYGPRLSKPYPFYDWVDQARDEITRRGETPVKLLVEPSGAELATPIKQLKESETAKEPGAEEPGAAEPDPDGRILRDTAQLLTSDIVVVPGRIKPGSTLRVHLRFRPAAAAHWNNEAEPAALWLKLPSGWKAEKQLLHLSQPDQPESTEERSIEFEIETSKENAEASTIHVKGYLLYYVCEENGGQCLYRRHDFVIPVRLELPQH